MSDESENSASSSDGEVDNNNGEALPLRYGAPTADFALKEKGIKKMYIKFTEERLARKADSMKKKEFNFLDCVSMIYDKTNINNVKPVTAYHLPMANMPTRAEIYARMTYLGLKREQDNVDKIKKELKEDGQIARQTAHDILEQVIVRHCKKEGIKTQLHSGNKIINLRQVNKAFRLCNSRDDVRKFVNVFLLRFETMTKWKSYMKMYLLQELGWMLDDTMIQQNGKLKDCFHTLCSNTKNQMKKNLNSNGDATHLWNIVLQKVGGQKTRRTRGEFETWMIVKREVCI